MANSLFFDANVMLELFFERPKAGLVSQTVLTLPEDTMNFTSILALGIFMYFVEKDKHDKTRAHKFLDDYQILDMNDRDYQWAKLNDKGDFEDALQVACARRHGCGELLTIDGKMDKMYGKYIRVLTVD